MRLSLSSLLSLLTFTLAVEASRKPRSTREGVSLRSSIKHPRDISRQVDGVSVIRAGGSFVAKVPCPECPPIHSAAEDEPTILLFYLTLSNDNKTILVDNQSIYPLRSPQAPLPTLHSRQWPAALAHEDIQTAIDDYESDQASDNMFSSDFKTLAYRRNVFPIVGSSADVIQLDILGVGMPVTRSDEDPAASSESDSDGGKHAGTPLESPKQKMIQLVVRRETRSGALSISRVDLVDRLPSSNSADPGHPAFSHWGTRLLDAFSTPPPEAYPRISSMVSTGGLTSYYQPPISKSTKLPGTPPVYPSTAGEWLNLHWLDIAVLLSTLLSAIFVLYLVYLAGSYLRHAWFNAGFDDFEYPEEQWARMQRAKRFQSIRARQTSLERVMEEGETMPTDWDEKRRHSVANSIAEEAERRTSESRPTTGRKTKPLYVRTGLANKASRKPILPPTPVESWEEGSGWGWGWGER